MTVAVSKAVEDGARAVICASTGNTAASAAAYAARAGIPAVVLQPVGAVTLGKLAQARAWGHACSRYAGTFDEALAAARELGRRGAYVLVNSVNPDRIEGQKTAAFEIAEELGGVPGRAAAPVRRRRQHARLSSRFRGARRDAAPRSPTQSAARAETVASAIRITEPAHTAEVERR